jgi:hypothetical protein
MTTMIETAARPITTMTPDDALVERIVHAFREFALRPVTHRFGDPVGVRTACAVSAFGMLTWGPACPQSYPLPEEVERALSAALGSTRTLRGLTLGIIEGFDGLALSAGTPPNRRRGYAIGRRVRERLGVT